MRRLVRVPGTMNQIESMNPTRFIENPNAQTHVALKLKIENSPLRRKPSEVLTQPAARTYVFYCLSIAFGFHPLKRMTASWTLVILKSCSWNQQLGRVFGLQHSRRMPRRQVRMGSQNSLQLRWRKETFTLESRLLSMDFLDFKDSLGW